MSMEKLLSIMARLRNPENGCPWDIEQTFETIAPYTIEEAYEILDAINESDYDALKDELGDLLLQVVYHSRMAEEKQLFDFSDVVKGVCEKMIRRHPHVFGDMDAKKCAKTVINIWESQKSEERKNKHDSILDGVAHALPALMRGVKLQNRAARVGFDWPNIQLTLEKLEEELEEVRHEISDDNISTDKQEEEIGDLLFSCVNLARKLDIDPEIAMRRANKKFEQRFMFIENNLKKAGISLNDATLEQMEELWQKAKVKH